MKLTAGQAKNLLYNGGEAEPDLGLSVESDEQVDTLRWTSVHRLVLKDRHGKYWAADYQRGLTENQDSMPFDDGSEVEFREIEKIPVMTFKYRDKI